MSTVKSVAASCSAAVTSPGFAKSAQSPSSSRRDKLDSQFAHEIVFDPRADWLAALKFPTADVSSSC